MGRYDSALEDFNKAIELNSSLDEIHFERAFVFYNKNMHKKALENLNKVIEINPDSEEGYLKRALVYKELKNFEKSIEDLSKVIELNYRLDEAYTMRGNCYIMQKKFRKALEDSNNAIIKNPRFIYAYINRAIVNVNLGNNDEAIIDINITLDLCNEDEEAKAMAYFWRGTAYLNLDNYTNAINDFSKSIELNNGYADSYISRGINYYKIKNCDKAIRDLSKGIELVDSDDTEALYWAYYWRGKIFTYLDSYDKTTKDRKLAEKLKMKLNNE